MSSAHDPRTGLGSSRRADGFSVIELMVAMALSLLLLGGVVAIFASSRTSYETTDRLSRIQENGRYALDQITSDVRAAGFPGCARRPIHRANALASATDLKWNFLDDAPIRGYQSTGSGTYAPASPAGIPSAPNGSDILLVRRPKRDSIPLRVTADMGVGTAAITVQNVANAGLAPDDIALISSCEATSYFQVRSFDGTTITHTVNGASATAPGNASADVGFPFRIGAQVVPVETVVYYIGDSGSGGVGATSLWRRIGGGLPEELIEGVEQMQLRFGVDTSGDNVVDVEQTANDVTNWDDVRSVEVALLVRSLDGYGGGLDTETYQLLDVPVDPVDDNRMREVFTTSISLRNRILVN